MRLLLFTNLWIALAAGLVTVETYPRLGAAPRLWPVPALVFFATLVVYNLDRLLRTATEDTVDRSPRHLWVDRHRRGLWVLTAVAAAGVLGSLVAMSWEVAAVLVILGAVCAAYVAPVVGRTREGSLRLKEVPGLKIFVITAVWTAATVALPALAVGAPAGRTAIVAVERFLFVFAICLPFDVRDLDRDRTVGIRTLPALLGVRATRWLAAAALVAGGLLVAAFDGVGLGGPGLPLLGASAVALGLVAAMRPGRSDVYYALFVDGTLVVQAVLVLAVVR